MWVLNFLIQHSFAARPPTSQRSDHRDAGRQFQIPRDPLPVASGLCPGQVTFLTPVMARFLDANRPGQRVLSLIR
jgi:hypothetical protein